LVFWGSGSNIGAFLATFGKGKTIREVSMAQNKERSAQKQRKKSNKTKKTKKTNRGIYFKGLFYFYLF
jgi:hypothetical protein